jgi:ATP-binding cassette subfamily F protein uup
MLAQRRGLDLERSPSRKRTSGPEERATEGDVPARSQPRRKLSFKEKHALETLPGTMTALEAEIATISARLSDPNLFTKDPRAFSIATERLATAQAELAGAEERWLELELLKEELGARE